MRLPAQAQGLDADGAYLEIHNGGDQEETGIAMLDFEGVIFPLNSKNKENMLIAGFTMNTIGWLQICMIGFCCEDQVIYQNYFWFGLN
jgi:hypothetical protein